MHACSCGSGVRADTIYDGCTRRRRVSDGQELLAQKEQAEASRAFACWKWSGVRAGVPEASGERVAGGAATPLFIWRGRGGRTGAGGRKSGEWFERSKRSLTTCGGLRWAREQDAEAALRLATRCGGSGGTRHLTEGRGWLRVRWRGRRVSVGTGEGVVWRGCLAWHATMMPRAQVLRGDPGVEQESGDHMPSLAMQRLRIYRLESGDYNRAPSV